MLYAYWLAVIVASAMPLVPALVRAEEARIAASGLDPLDCQHHDFP